MESGLCDRGDDGEYNDVGFVDVSKILVTQSPFLLRNKLFDAVYIGVCNEVRESQLTIDRHTIIPHMWLEFSALNLRLTRKTTTYDEDQASIVRNLGLTDKTIAGFSSSFIVSPRDACLSLAISQRSF